MKCEICSTEMDQGSESCGACGAPAGPRAAKGERTACPSCGTDLWSLAETCPKCGEQGYPGLRPRFGDGSRGRD
jgi:hypothetical protein